MTQTHCFRAVRIFLFFVFRCSHFLALVCISISPIFMPNLIPFFLLSRLSFWSLFVQLNSPNLVNECRELGPITFNCNRKYCFRGCSTDAEQTKKKKKNTGTRQSIERKVREWANLIGNYFIDECHSIRHPQFAAQQSIRVANKNSHRRQWKLYNRSSTGSIKIKKTWRTFSPVK